MARGVAIQRVRIVSVPVSHYIVFEHADTSAVNIAAGESIRWLSRRHASDLALPGNDAWVFDDQVVEFYHFAGDGSYLGNEVTESPGVVQRAGLKQLNAAVRDIYERTKVYRSYGADIIPGLLQTRDYTTAILESIRRRRGVPVNDVAEAVDERLARQHILDEGDHRFAFILESAALRYQIGGSAVLAAQLHHLRKVMSLPSVSISVIPFEIDRTDRWAVESFYAHDESQVNVELVSGFLTITNPREVHMYLQAFAELSRMAVTGKAAHQLINEALSELE